MNWHPGITIEIAEQIVIEEAFKWYRGNKTQTAQAIGISIRTLDSKLDLYAHKRRDEELRIEKAKLERDRLLRRFRAQAEPEGLLSADTGMRMEPSLEAKAEHEMSLSERTEVQEVLSRQASKGRTKREGQRV